MRHLIALALTFLLLAAACGDDDDGGDASDSPTASPSEESDSPTPDESPTTTPGRPTATGGGVSDCSGNLDGPAIEGEPAWEAIAPDEIPAPPGYAVVDAEGEGPFLDVLRGEERVGSVELLAFPTPDVLDPQAGFDGLEVFVQEFYASVETDRTTVDPAVEFTADEPAPVPFGELCGVGYGYTVRKDGEIVERFTAAATYDPEGIYLVTAAYDEADPETSWSDLEALQEYESYLRELVAELDVPAE